jgi:hypothetical protein
LVGIWFARMLNLWNKTEQGFSNVSNRDFTTEDAFHPVIYCVPLRLVKNAM